MQEMSPIKCIRTRQKARMLLNPKHKLLRDHPEKDALVKVAATTYVLIRYGMKEDKLEIKIKKIGKEFGMTERQIREVIMSRLYGSAGTRCDKYFQKHKRAQAADQIDWEHEQRFLRDDEEVLYMVESEDQPEGEGMQSEDIAELKPVKTTVQATPYFPRKTTGTALSIVHLAFGKKGNTRILLQRVTEK